MLTCFCWCFSIYRWTTNTKNVTQWSFQCPCTFESVLFSIPVIFFSFFCVFLNSERSAPQLRQTKKKRKKKKKRLNENFFGWFDSYLQIRFIHKMLIELISFRLIISIVRRLSHIEFCDMNYTGKACNATGQLEVCSCMCGLMNSG